MARIDPLNKKQYGAVTAMLVVNDIKAATTFYQKVTETVDKVVAKAVSLGATPKGEVADMFWGDRCGTVADPDGYTWTVATHIANPTPEEMKKKLKEQMRAQAAGPEKGRDSSADEVSPKTRANRNKPKQ